MVRAMVYVCRVISGIGRDPDFAPPRGGIRRRRRRWAESGWTIVDDGGAKLGKFSPPSETSGALVKYANEGSESNDGGLCGWGATTTLSIESAFDQYSAWRVNSSEEGSASGNWNAIPSDDRDEDRSVAPPVMYVGRKRGHRRAKFFFGELSFELFIRGTEEDGEADFDIEDVEETFPCWETFHGDAAATAEERFELFVCSRYAEYLREKESRRSAKFKLEDGLVEMDF